MLRPTLRRIRRLLPQDEAPGIVGHWRGDLVIPSGAVEMIFFVERDGDGWKGTVDTPAQGIFGLPLTVEAGAGDEAYVLGVPATAGAFEGLNHLFQHCETGQVKEYGRIEETFSPEVLGALTDWITRRFVSGR